MSCSAASAARLARLRAAYAAAGAGGMLVRATSNVCWLTAFDGVFDEEQAHALFVDDGLAVLHTDSRYAAACERAACAGGGAVEVDAARETHAAFAARLWGNAEGRAEAAADSDGEAAAPAPSAAEGDAPAPAPAQRAGEWLAVEDSITLAEFRRLERAFAPGSLAETSEVVLGLRAVKDASEVARMRAAQAVTDAAFDHIIAFMRPGMTEREVQLELEGFMLSHGASGLAFSSIVAAGANGANPHAIPGDTVLESGQCVVLDFGAKARGYCSDMTRTVFLGAPSGAMLDAWQTLRRANEEVEGMLRPGVTGREAHELAERILAEGGFGGRMGHGLGHGVGLDVHEEPVLAPRNTCALEPGNVVTVEPGIYLPGAFGMRLEDFGIVTQDGFEVFARSTHEMVVL
ncbi:MULTISPECIES: Xaa-Pro peptidase family protein [unclassified Adlercreutzia]|uniref:M24 family metallopeptidase n=1 Tax=unclassified Adlercreutzia TaxID=2636013 RepID=UPI0013EE1694|nr:MULTISPECIES: Xaa-Pro peptidase family protein [unclassified Adlercreutzia]